MKRPAFPIRSFSGWPLFGHVSPGSFVSLKSVKRVRTSASGQARLERDHLLLRLLAVLDELAVELRERLAPVELPFLDLVELLFHPRRVLGLEEVVEALAHEVHDDAAERRRREAPVLLPHVLAVLDLAQDLGVRGRAADAVLLEELHERRLVEARRRLRLVPLGRRLGDARRRRPRRARAGAPSRRRPSSPSAGRLVLGPCRPPSRRRGASPASLRTVPGRADDREVRRARRGAPRSRRS